MARIKQTIWVRRDRDTGDLMEVTEADVRKKISDTYRDINLAISNASKSAPLTTGFADYYPVEL